MRMQSELSESRRLRRSSHLLPAPLVVDVPTRTPWRIEAWLAIAAGLAVVAYRFFWMSSRSLDFPYPLDYGEGAVLDIAVRLARLENIYPTDLANPPWFVANYPPLYYLVRAAFIWVDGTVLWHGRLISQLSGVAVAVLVGMVLFRVTRNAASGVLGGLTFLSIPFVAAWAQYDRVDMLALALNWLGVWTVVRAERFTWPAVIWFVASGFTRQTGPVAGMVASYVWLWDRSGAGQANRLLLWVCGSGLALLVALDGATGGGFIDHVIRGTAGPLSATQFINLARQPVALMPLLLALAVGALLIAFWRKPAGWTLVASYVIAAGLLSLTVAKVGSYINYFLDLSAGCGLAAGACLAWVSARRYVAGAVLATLSLQALLMVRPNRLYDHLNTRLGASNGYARLTQIVRHANGPVLADEAMALLPLEDRRADFHPFAMVQLSRTGQWDESRFIDTLRQRRFSVILLRIPGRNPRILRSLWTDRMAAAITDNYERVEGIPVDDRAVIAVYRPKSGT